MTKKNYHSNECLGKLVLLFLALYESIRLHFFTTIFAMGLTCGIKGMWMKEHNKTDTYSFENGVMESSGVMWIGACAVARNVERCATWNEAECGLGHARYLVVEVVYWSVMRGNVMRNMVVGCGIRCDHSHRDVVEWCKMGSMWNAVQCVKCGARCGGAMHKWCSQCMV